MEFQAAHQGPGELTPLQQIFKDHQEHLNYIVFKFELNSSDFPVQKQEANKENQVACCSLYIHQLLTACFKL